MTGEPDQSPGAASLPSQASSAAAPGTAATPATRAGNGVAASKPAQPPAADDEEGWRPGAAGDTLLEITKRLHAFERLERRADAGERHPAERISHLVRLLVMVRYCIRHGLPYDNCLIAIATQAIDWHTARKVEESQKGSGDAENATGAEKLTRRFPK